MEQQSMIAKKYPLGAEGLMENSTDAAPMNSASLEIRALNRLISMASVLSLARFRIAITRSRSSRSLRFLQSSASINL